MITLLCVIGALILLFLIWTAIGTFSGLQRANKTAAALSPEAADQYHFWNTQFNKATALGNEREAKINHAKALSVAAANCPILDMGNSRFPLVCQPGYIDSLSEAELDEHISKLEGQE